MQQTDIITNLTNVLNKYLKEVQGAESVFISTLDGNIICEAHLSHPLEKNLSPIAGSILGLSESLVEIVNGKQLHENISVMQDYILGLFKVHDQEDSLFFGVKCSRILSMGKMINFAKSTIKEINSALEVFNENSEL